MQGLLSEASFSEWSTRKCRMRARAAGDMAGGLYVCTQHGAKMWRGGGEDLVTEAALLVSEEATRRRPRRSASAPSLLASGRCEQHMRHKGVR